MSRVLVLLFRKKTQPNKNIKANKTHRKKQKNKTQGIVFLIALISFFLLPGNLFLFHFFPVQSQQLEALQNPEAAPAPPATSLSWGSWCAVLRVQSLTWEAQAPSEGEKENLLQRHYTVCYHSELTSLIPETSSHTGHHQLQMFFAHIKNQREGAFLPPIHFLQSFWTSQPLTLSAFPHGHWSQLL